MKTGILLYGPPASGKDTVTTALAELDSSYGLFSRLKVGSGRTQGYRMASREQLEAMESRGDVLYRNDRYDSTYVVDRPGLDEAMSNDRVPIVHLGQIEGVQQVAASYPARWWQVLLRCPRDLTELRSSKRGDTDTPARLAAWDATERDLAAHPDTAWDLTIHTGDVPAQEAAILIHERIRAHP